MGESERFQVLSLSGGGVRGLYSISILAELEKELSETHRKPDYNIASHFDLISGTSIGGILALGLASGLNARHLCRILDNHRQEIFYKSMWRKIPILGGIFGALKQSCASLYDQEKLKNVLIKESVFGKKKVGDLKTRVVIPAVNGTSGKPKMFKTPHHSDFKFDRHLSLIDVALATSAAPTFFNPHLADDKLMVDGGLIANSPSLVAYHEATHFLNISKNNLHILHIGTMGIQPTLNSDKKSNLWGYLTGWGMGSKLVELTLSANEGLHNFITKQLLGDNFVELDEPNTPDQCKSITLDNGNDSAAQMLRGRGKDKAQFASAMPEVMRFFEGESKDISFSLS